MNDRIWYHGAQMALTVIRKGSSISPYRNVAIAFSHRPVIVSLEDDGTVRHNGTAHGYLHRIMEDLTEEDITLHPACAEGEDWEWLVNRDIRVELIAEFDVDPDFYLTEEDIAQLKAQQAD